MNSGANYGDGKPVHAVKTSSCGATLSNMLGVAAALATLAGVPDPAAPLRAEAPEIPAPQAGALHVLVKIAPPRGAPVFFKGRFGSLCGVRPVDGVTRADALKLRRAGRGGELCPTCARRLS